MKEEPPADAKCRDKFLVQSVVVAASKELDNIQTLVRSDQDEEAELYLTNLNSGQTSSKPTSRRYKKRRSASSSFLPTLPPCPPRPRQLPRRQGKARTAVLSSTTPPAMLLILQMPSLRRTAQRPQSAPSHFPKRSLHNPRASMKSSRSHSTRQNDQLHPREPARVLVRVSARYRLR